MPLLFVQLQLLVLTVATLVWLGLRIHLLLVQSRQLRRSVAPAAPVGGPLQAARGTSASGPPAPLRDPPTVIAGAAMALAAPPSFAEAIAFVDRTYNRAHLTAPLGWYRRTDGTPDCAALRYLNGTYHTLISGQSRCGKDNVALGILFALAMRYAPAALQVCILDGKGLDFCGWRGKAHTWQLATAPDEIAPAIKALSAERDRRRRLLEHAGVSKWENYRGGDLPLLVVYISELSLLGDAIGRPALSAWLNSELAAGAAFGLRYIVATQTASNFSTAWRSQISLYIAGYQPSQSQDEPNISVSAREIGATGAVPPSALPAPPDGAGVFTCLQGRDAVTLRVPHLCDAQRTIMLRRLPDAEVHLSDDRQGEVSTAPEPAQRWNETHERIASWLRADATLSIREIARRLYPGTSGGGDYSVKTKPLVEHVRLALELPTPVFAVRPVRPVRTQEQWSDTTTVGVDRHALSEQRTAEQVY